MANFDLGKILMEVELIGKRKSKAELNDFMRTVDKSVVGLKRLINSQVQLDKQRQKAARDAKKEEDNAKAARDRAKASYDKLLGSIDPVVAAQQRLAKVQQTLNSAVKAGHINTQQAKVALDQYRASAMAAGVQFDKLGNVMDVAGRRAKKFASAGLQQVGYQVGDFAVQVQSGTNVAVAFGQQMSQLLGIFGAGGAIAGAAVAIGTAFIAPMFRAKQEAADYKKQLQEIPGLLADIDAITFSGGLDSFKEVAQAAREEFETILGIMEQVKYVQLEEALLGPVRAIAGEIESFEYLKQGADRFGKNIEFDSQFGFTTPVQAENVASQLMRLQGIYDPDELRAEYEKVVEAIQFMLGFEVPAEVQRMLAEMGESLGIADALQTMVDEGIRTEKKITDDAEEEAKRRHRILAHMADIRNEREAEAAAERMHQEGMAYQTYFAGVQKVHAIILRNEQEQTQLAQDRRTVTDALQKQYLKSTKQRIKDEKDAEEAKERELQRVFQFNQNARLYMSRATNSALIKDSQNAQVEYAKMYDALEKEVGEIGVQALILAGVDISKPIEDAVKEAAKLADHFKTSLESAQGIQSLANTQSAKGSGYEALSNEYTLRMATGVGAPPPKTKDKKTQKSPLQRLREELELEQALVGASEARERVVKALGLQFSEKNPKTVEGLIKQIEATNELEAAEQARLDLLEKQKQQQEQLAESINSSMEDAFMSIIDGTKSVEDAFRDMARQIISELFRVLVVKKAVASFTSGIPFLNADGNVFNNGNVIPYANGGVVGGPTYFPMANGKTGLMGEAGPEAIMPLSRGSDGKLGVNADGMGAVTIQQTFNFAANGDDSVKRIIVQSMPQITEAAKAGVLDARKRGGSFRKVFA